LDAQRVPLDKISPVTAEMLTKPVDGDWLHWRRTYDGRGYTPLKQINRRNVKNLKVAWTHGLGSTGIYEFTPLVHDGIIFMWQFGETVHALDATNGTVLWQYTHWLPADYSTVTPLGFDFFKTKRSIAIGGNLLLVPTGDMHLLALDVKTGRVVWDVVTDEYHEGRTYPSGSLVIRDKVLIGAGNCGPGTANSGKGYFPPAAASSLATTWRPASSCGASTPWPSRMNLAATPGTAFRPRSSAAPRSGSQASMAVN
jgi:alcohol dehydrogenase (cytochrome c)